MDKNMIDEQTEVFRLVIDDMMSKLESLKIESVIVIVKQDDHINMATCGNDDDLREMISDVTKQIKELAKHDTRPKEFSTPKEFGNPDDLDKAIFSIIMETVFLLQEIGFEKAVIALRKGSETLRVYRGKSQYLSSMLEFLRRKVPQRLLKQEGDD